MTHIRPQIPEEESKLLQKIEALARFFMGQGSEGRRIHLSPQQWKLLNRIHARSKEHVVFDRNNLISYLDIEHKTYRGYALTMLAEPAPKRRKQTPFRPC